MLELRQNYRSARESVESLRKVYNEEIREGRVIKMPMAEARNRYGDRLRIAPQGAVGKKDGDKRPIHDGAHGPAVDPNIRIRDQLRYPRGAELRHAAADMERRGGATFGLTADVSKAHRRFKHRPQDHGLLCCVLDDEPTTALINTVGTFGLGSASYWWGREFAILARVSMPVLLAHHV